ncbi:GTP pyrophosphokinase [Miniphocaeibacter massiliensis]|uniref:GTP pyrophosphokinase n=1 Tax=Miniphocaeibacter massiliensis TaxID=2041841 RepID=UPI000C1BA590|nr:GTP pyrophosphokinase [Miniphocaeibacter massiliensis]
MELEYLKNRGYKEFYEDKLKYIEKAMEIIYEKIKCMGEKHLVLEDRNPIEHVKYRVKHPKSVKEKLERQKLEVSLENSLNEIQDVCGFRIVCTFISDVKYIIKKIEEIENITVVIKKDYINKPKKNGYRSYHIILSLPVEINGVIEKIYVELQIRTIAMDCWASLEHQLMYKKDISKRELFKEELKKCADEMATTDLNLETIMTFIESEGI